MNLASRKLLTIVVETTIAHRLTDDLIALGAKGFTSGLATGTGPKDSAANYIDGGNLRIETVVKDDVLERILEKLEASYFPNYSVTAWVTDVGVIRQDRY